MSASPSATPLAGPSATESPAVCGYVCKYTPVALLSGCGLAPVRLLPDDEDLSSADSVLHPNVCGYAKAIAASALRGEIRLVCVMDCCDGLRRCADAMRRYTAAQPLVLGLPRRTDGCARDLFASQLLSFVDRLEEVTGRPFNLGRAVASVDAGAETPNPGPYLAVVGARLEPQLLSGLESRCSLPVRDLTCMGAQPIGPVPDEARSSKEAFVAWYAGALLGQEGCMRMAAGADRRSLVADPDLAGVIYHGIKFCDYYSYDYQALASQLDVPITRIETDWTSAESGQVLTRMDALLESMGVMSGEGPGNAEKRQVAQVSEGDVACFAGIDSGSTSTDVVVIDNDCRVVAHVVRPTGARAVESARVALQEALAQAGIDEGHLARTVGTGYGRTGIGLADEQVTEITCHARGAHHMAPDARTVIDIGGQDSKAIRLAEDGSVASFAMNDKCAAGTGRFLEAMARTLELDVGEMARMGTKWDEDIALTTMCTVFAESEVVSLIAENKKTEDIVHGIDASVASKTASLVRRVGGGPGYVMTGGVALNAGVVAALEARLGAPVEIPPYPQACGALGAALIARDHALGR